MANRSVLTHRLESRLLDIVHVEREGEAPFTFLPFDDAKVQSAEFLGDDHLLVIAAFKLAIWHLPTRERTVLATPIHQFSKGDSRTMSAHRGSLFIKDADMDFANRHANIRSYVRELRLDGSLDRRFELPRAAIGDLGALDDGRVVAYSHFRDRHYFTLLDPDTGALDEHDLPPGFSAGDSHYAKVRISPDGRLAVRCHLGSVARFPHAAAELFERPDSRAAIVADRWPDRPAGDREPWYGTAYDVYDTRTGGLVQRLLGGLKSVADIHARRRESRRRDAECREEQAIIDDLADRDGERQIIFRDVPYEDKPARDAMRDLSVPFRLLLEDDVAWTPDSHGLIVPAGKGWRRTIGLDGTVGPIEAAPGWTYRQAPKAAVARISRELTERSTVTIVVPDETAAGATAALAAMADRIEGGIAPLLFRDALTFVFKSGRRRIGETSFFKELRQHDPAPFVPLLRRIVGSFGAWARTIRPVAHEQFMLGERSRPEYWRTALAPAALLLAETDPQAGDWLRDWFLCVDQEHDDFAATKVMMGFAKASAFANEGAVRFGLFFLLQQWQTLAYHPTRLRLIDAARRCPASTVAAWIAQERTLIDSARPKGPTAATSLVAALLKPGKSWDDEVRRALAERSDPAPDQMPA